MNEIKTHNLPISEKFLMNMHELTKTAIKVYLSLAMYKKKFGNNFYASHGEIRIHSFNEGFNSEWFGIGNDHAAFLKAMKQLEELKLIKVYRSKSVGGKPLTNRYRVY